MSRSTQTLAPKRSISDALAHVTAEISSMLERGVMPWRAPWDPELALATTPSLPLRSTGEPYRGANVVLLWAAQISRGYQRRTWLTYRQTLHLGGQVRRGEKACPVIYYGQAISKTHSSADVSAGDASGESPRGYRFLKLFHVFNIEQCEGVELGVEPPTPSSDVHALQAWLTLAGANVRIGGDRAFYAPSVDAIHIPPMSAFLSDEHWAATLAHEGVHFTGHASRLDRLADYASDRKARAREELVAELGSALIGAMTGIAPYHLEDHAAYLADWLKVLRDDPRAFLSAGAKAQTAIDWLIAKAGPPPGAPVEFATPETDGGEHA